MNKELTGCKACSGYGKNTDGSKCSICKNGVVEQEKPKIFDTHEIPKGFYARFSGLFEDFPIVVINGKKGYFIEIKE